MAGRNRVVYVAALLVVVCGRARGTNYFVSPTGNDSHNGSSSSPWLTLQHAADAVHAGDFVTVATGNYTGFYLDTSGTAAAPIEFLAQPPCVGCNRDLLSDGTTVTSSPILRTAPATLLRGSPARW